jgi:hypothetical protein
VSCQTSQELSIIAPKKIGPGVVPKNKGISIYGLIFLLLAAKFYKPPKDQKETNIPPPNVIDDNENLKNTKELTKL